MAIGAVCQWALTMRIDVGLGRFADQPSSSAIHCASSSSGGAPWPRYSAGSGGVGHGRTVGREPLARNRDTVAMNHMNTRTRRP